MKYFNLLFGALFFFAFAYDMEHTRSMFTWGWLFLSILNLAMFFSEYIIDKIKEK